MTRPTQKGPSPVTLLATLFCVICLPNFAISLPLISEDRIALTAFIQGVVPPPEGAPSVPPLWDVQTVPSICDTQNFTEITCGLFNSTHSTVLEIQYPYHFYWRFMPGIQNFRSINTFSLPNFVLVGGIAPELGQLTTLQRLFLRDSGAKPRLTEWYSNPPIPSQIGNLLNLRVLRLMDLLINGTVPSSFSSLSLLTELNLRGNLLRSPLPDLSGMTSMTVLDISSNMFDEPLPNYFGSLSSLRSLNANTNNFRGTLPTFASNPQNLTSISLADNFLTGPLHPSITQLPNLEVLNLEYNDLSGTIPSVWAVGMEEIFLGGNKFNGTLPEGLRYINASTLTYLDVSDNNLVDSLDSRTWLSQFSRLLKLHLGGNNWGSSTIPKWINSTSFSRLESLRLHDGGFIGDVPPALATMPSLETLDVSDNYLNCPNYTVTPRESNLWYGNYFCADDPELILQPGCTSVPESGRYTPCRHSREETLLTGTCTSAGDLIELTTALVPPGVSLLYDPCRPRFRLQVTTTTGSVWTELDVTQVGDCNVRYCYVNWPTQSISWSVYLSYIRTRNNSFVPEVSYRGRLPNGGSFTLPFWYFARADHLKLYESWLPVEPATIKFGLEVTRFKRINIERESYLGLDVQVRTSEPVLVQSNFLEFVASLSNGSLSSSFGLEFTRTKGVINFRVPLLGQTDQKVNIGGTFNSDSFNKTDAVIKIVNSIPIEGILIPLRLKLLKGRLLSYDPDLAMLLDPAALSIPPSAAPTFASFEVAPSNIGVAVGVSAAAVVLVACVLVVVLVIKKRNRAEEDRRKLQDRLKQQTTKAEESPDRQRSVTASASWRSASIPTRTTNIESEFK